MIATIRKLPHDFPHEHDERRPQAFGFFDGTFQTAQFSYRIEGHVAAAVQYFGLFAQNIG